MKNRILLMIFSWLLVFQVSQAQPRNARFYLWNISNTNVDAAVYIWVGCTQPMTYRGYQSALSNDTFYIKPIWGYGGCLFGGSFNRDTMRDVALPAGINYVNISTNFRSYSSSLQTYDTTWNIKDSTFALRPVGIKDIGKNASHIVLYPNPAQGMLTLKAAPAYTKAVIYNTAGRCIARHRYTPAKSIDISTLAPGVYYLKLMGKKEEVVGSTRFVVGR